MCGITFGVYVLDLLRRRRDKIMKSMFIVDYRRTEGVESDALK